MNFRNFKIATLALILFAGISSCNEDDDNTPNNPNNPSGISIGTIRAKVDGTMKTATNYVQASIYGSSVQLSGTGGPNTNILTFNLGIGDFTGVGNYELGIHDSHGLGVNAIYQESSLGIYSCTPQYSETTGKLIVTEYTASKSIKGTFHFKGKKQGSSGSGGDYIDVTDGEFYISLE